MSIRRNQDSDTGQAGLVPDFLHAKCIIHSSFVLVRKLFEAENFKKNISIHMKETMLVHTNKTSFKSHVLGWCLIQFEGEISSTACFPTYCF
jgi:hypothetical protein